jgi:CheY-like chemotaxis protein
MLNILWLDDEPQFLSHISKAMPSDFHVLAVSSASEALESLQANRNLDVIVVDLMFSDDTRTGVTEDAGINVLEAIKKIRPNSKPIPIIAYSSYLGDQADKMGALGVDHFISKSESSSIDFVEVVRHAVATSRQKPAPEPEATLVADIRTVIREEIARLTPARERTLHIPGEAGFELIKPLIGYKRDIEQQLSQFPYEQNVFLMMKFRSSNQELGEFIIENLAAHGLRGVRADHDDWNITHNIYNPIAVLYCCKFGIALFDEAEAHQAYSANVAYELGMMHSQNKDCLILKHASLPDVPFDLIKDLHCRYERDLGVRPMITAWIRQTRVK